MNLDQAVLMGAIGALAAALGALARVAYSEMKADRDWHRDKSGPILSALSKSVERIVDWIEKILDRIEKILERVEHIEHSVDRIERIEQIVDRIEKRLPQ